MSTPRFPDQDFPTCEFEVGDKLKHNKMDGQGIVLEVYPYSEVYTHGGNLLVQWTSGADVEFNSKICTLSKNCTLIEKHK